MPEEVADYLGKNTIYSPDDLQDCDSIFCGLWCISFLFERQKGTPVLHQRRHGRKFIISYFVL